MSRIRVVASPGGGWHHVLDDEPLRYRESVELRVGDGWLRGEYVWSYQPYAPAFLALRLGCGSVMSPHQDVLVPLPPSAELRRPPDQRSTPPSAIADQGGE